MAKHIGTQKEKKIVALIKAGARPKDVAEMMGVTASCVTRVVKRATGDTPIKFANSGKVVHVTDGGVERVGRLTRRGGDIVVKFNDGGEMVIATVKDEE